MIKYCFEQKLLDPVTKLFILIFAFQPYIKHKNPLQIFSQITIIDHPHRKLYEEDRGYGTSI